MLKVILLPICLIACVAICFGQSNKTATLDLSGTWEFDAARSHFENSKSPPERIKITYQDPQLTIRRKVKINGVPEERDLIYYTDGRGETNPTTSWMSTDSSGDSYRPTLTTSKTTLSKDKIVIRSLSRTYAGAAIVEFEIIEEFRVSSDGKTLTKTSRTVPSKDVPANVAFFGRGAEFKMIYKLISK
jgi:hypothetical protein